jgi:hypothetical protein
LTTEHDKSRDLLFALPDIEVFRRQAQSLAALDAILSPEWQFRYYSFNAAWAEGEMMASMRNGAGDHWFAIINGDGAVVHGLAHESSTFEPGEPKPWVFASLPAEFHDNFLREPAFDTSNSTYCLWRLLGSDHWSRGALPSAEIAHADGMVEHLGLLTEGPAGCLRWAADYHEVELHLADVEAVFRHAAITPELACRMNPEINFEVLQSELRQIGYR